MTTDAKSSEIFIGTSGWSFQDWKGPFYPKDLVNGEMLEHYNKYFNCTEVNSTYYKIPHYKVFEHLRDKTTPDFTFTVKFNRLTTHEHSGSIEAVRQLEEVVSPLKESGKFGGYLGQFPYSFKNTESNRKFLATLREAVLDDPVFIEFRHESWLSEPVYPYLSQHQLGYVCVDEPPLKGLLPAQSITTTDTGYIRLHGRNTKTWWNSKAGDRYDYSYSNEELDEWITRVNTMKNRVAKLYIFFNNCHHGQAPQNAISFQFMTEQSP